MAYQTYFLKFIIVNTYVLILNTVNVYARSIEDNNESLNNDQPFYKIPFIVCIIGVVAVAASGGFCLFSSKKQKKMSEEHLTNQNSSPSTNINSPVSSSNEVPTLNPELEEADITIQVDKQNEDEIDSHSENEEEPPKKRRSILDTLLNRNSKKDRISSMQFMEDRSLNSISTNEDWIVEQKYQAELKGENLNSGDLFEDEEAYSNDGFWNSDLEPIQSSSNNNKQESYGIPSLGKRNSVIVKRNSELNGKHQSVIIIDDDNNKINSSSSSAGSTGDLKPTRVKSWKDSDINKEIMELLKNLEEETKLNDMKQVA